MRARKLIAGRACFLPPARARRFSPALPLAREAFLVSGRRRHEKRADWSRCRRAPFARCRQALVNSSLENSPLPSTGCIFFARWKDSAPVAIRSGNTRLSRGRVPSAPRSEIPAGKRRAKFLPLHGSGAPMIAPRPTAPYPHAAAGLFPWAREPYRRAIHGPHCRLGGQPVPREAPPAAEVVGILSPGARAHTLSSKGKGGIRRLRRFGMAPASSSGVPRASRPA